MKLYQPADLPTALQHRFERAAERVRALDIEGTDDTDALSAGRVLTVSDFVVSALEYAPAKLLARVSSPEPPIAKLTQSEYALDGLSEADAMHKLRRFRQIELARIAWRDIEAHQDLAATLRDLSALAVTAVRAALDFATLALEPRYGRPALPDGSAAPLLVLAMGKLGGSELNFSSDIDVVFLYFDEARISGCDASAIQPYYVRLAQTLIKLLDRQTADGFVFRTDVRLRPFGNSGPLAISLSAFEQYLVSNGRDWERYAYQKARLITGSRYAEQVFDEILTPYVYRRYLDYGVFEALRQMNRLIRQEVARRDLADNIKLGPGGIREIEFIVQAFQLVRGGRDASLRGQSLLPVLPRLADEHSFSAGDVAALEAAYRYLRRLENVLQALNDRQTHLLPDDPETRARVAFAMRAESWDALSAELTEHRAIVEQLFDTVAHERSAVAAVDEPANDFEELWTSGDRSGDSDAQPAALSSSGWEMLRNFRNSQLFERMDEMSRQRLVAVVNETLHRIQSSDVRDVVLQRILPIYQSICRRSAYLALLRENSTALDNLIALAKRSQHLSREIADRPILLDELLDPRIFDTPPTRAEFRDLLARQLATVPRHDTEASLDAMRQFHSAAIFRIAVADTLGQLPLMQVSDRLTDTAELVVRFALELAWYELGERYGRPFCESKSESREAGFAVIAYGKLGGLELGYGSDLDLVFLHDSSGGLQQTNGAKSIDNAVFFARLAQRLLHYLSIQTTAGRLYEVDTRLRPSGNSGPLVASMANFHQYQRNQAWVWEHQALLRSRPIAGTPSVCEEFVRERSDILRHAVDRTRLRSEVVKMRARMRRELSLGTGTTFDLKQDTGGLADIEFLVDYLVLENLPQWPDLADYPDNIRQIEALERARLLSAEDAASLRACYLSLRKRAHDLALDGRERAVPNSEFVVERQLVKSAWDELFGADEVAE